MKNSLQVIRVAEENGREGKKMGGEDIGHTRAGHQDKVGRGRETRR